MTAIVSDKIIVITDQKGILEPVEIALKRHNFEVARGFMNLFSLSIIRTQVAGAKGIDFIAGEYFRFVREVGQPFAIILDGKINCGLPAAEDPDGTLFFKKLLLAGMVIAHGKGFERYRGNFLLLAKDEDHERLKDITLNPRALLKSIETGDKTTAEIIGKYIKDIFRFGNTFYIECAPGERSGGEVMSSVDRFLSEIKNRSALARLKSEGVPVDTSSTEPAVIIYVAENGRITADGGEKDGCGDDYSGHTPGEFYIEGNWTSRTQMEVAKKLSRLILKGVNGNEPFEKDARIVVNIYDRTNIDASTAASIAGVLAKELSDFENITFVTNKEKGFQLKNSPGFSLIQKRIRMKQ